MVWLVVVAIMVLPVLLIRGLVEFPAVMQAVEDGWRRLRGSPPAAVPTTTSVQQLAADLHRLADALDRLEASDAPAKVARLRAATQAYDDVLLIACRALEVPAPEKSPLDAVDRLQTEAALAQQGLVW